MNETVKILRFEAGDSVKTLKELKDYIAAAKENLSQLTIGTEEYNEQLRELQAAQDAQRDSLNLGVKTVKAAKGSYNDLVHEMRELKQAWRATNDEAKRDALGSRISVINAELKSLDASVGNFSRNVGDYRNSIAEVSVLLDGKAKKAFEDTGKALGALSKNPVMGTFALLLPLILKIADALKDNETATKAFNKALDALQPVFDLLDKALEAVAGLVSNVVDKFADLSKGSDGALKKVVAGAAGVGNAIAQYLLTPVKTAIAAFKGLGNIIGDVFKGNFGDIKKHAQEAAEGVQQAVKEGFSFKANFEAGKAAGEKFAEGIGTGKRKAKDAAKGTAKAATDELAKALEAQKDILQKELSLMDGFTPKRLQKERELRAKQREIDRHAAKVSIKDATDLARTLELIEEQYRKDLIAIDRKYVDAAVQEEHQRLANRVTAAKEGSEEYLAAVTALRRFERDALIQAEGETDAAFEGRRLEAEKALREAVTAEADKMLEDEKIRRENRLAALQEGSQEYLEEAVRLKTYELETLHQIEGESNDAFRAREIAAEKALADTRKQLAAQQLATNQQYAASVSGLATAVADAYEAMSGDSEKAAEDMKALRIGAAIIDTISGAIAAYMAVWTSSALPATARAILAPIQAAAVTAMGMANVAKIRSTGVKGSGGGASGATVPATVGAPAIVQQVPVTRSLTSATEEERMDRMAGDQRVYLVFDDVLKAGRYVETVEEEGQF